MFQFHWYSSHTVISFSRYDFFSLRPFDMQPRDERFTYVDFHWTRTRTSSGTFRPERAITS